MAYTEALFLFLTILCLYGMERRWPLVVIALLIGLTTAARLVGVALIPPFILHVCALRYPQSSPGFDLPGRCR